MFDMRVRPEGGRMRGVLGADDDYHTFAATTQQIIDEVGQRRLTKLDRELVENIINFERGVVPMEEAGERILDNERHLAETGHALDCHAKVYWRFRKYYEASVAAMATTRTEKQEPTLVWFEDYNGVYPTSRGRTPSYGQRARRSSFRNEESLKDFSDTLRSQDQDQSEPAMRVDTDIPNSSDSPIAASSSGWRRRPRKSPVRSPNSKSPKSPSQMSPKAVPHPKSRSPQTDEPHSGSAPARELPNGSPSEQGRGAVKSSTNPFWIPTETGRPSNMPNPFFATLPGKETWFRRMPSALPFGETPFAEAKMSAEIDEDLKISGEKKSFSSGANRPPTPFHNSYTALERTTSRFGKMFISGGNGAGTGTCSNNNDKSSKKAGTGSKSSQKPARPDRAPRPYEELTQPRPFTWALPAIGGQREDDALYAVFGSGAPSKRKASLQQSGAGLVADKRGRYYQSGKEEEDENQDEEDEDEEDEDVEEEEDW